jgi:hypothetical protein
VGMHSVPGVGSPGMSAPPGGPTLARPSIARAHRWALPFGRLPAIGQVLLAYSCARLFSILALTAISRYAPPPPGRVAPVPFRTEISLWDGGWYQQVARDGYPTHLPRDAAGHILASSWAYFPVFPLTVGQLARWLGTGFAQVAVPLNLALGAVAAVLLYRVARGHGRLSHQPALLGVTAWSLAPAAPVLSFLYTEALAAVLVLAILKLLIEDRYLMAAAPVLVLGLSRPLAVPMALTVGIQLALRLRTDWRGRRGPSRLRIWGKARSVPIATLARMSVLLVICAVAVCAWPLIAGRVTGVPDAYLQTMAAWRPKGTLAPFAGWWTLIRQHFALLPAGLLTAALAIGAAGCVLIGPARRVPVLVRVWTLALLGYLAAVVPPTTSVLRYLLLAFALWLAIGAILTERRRLAVCTLTALASGQVVWLLLVWHHASRWTLMP